jgi:hypothetical protein
VLTRTVRLALDDDEKVRFPRACDKLAAVKRNNWLGGVMENPPEEGKGSKKTSDCTVTSEAPPTTTENGYMPASFIRKTRPEPLTRRRLSAANTLERQIAHLVQVSPPPSLCLPKGHVTHAREIGVGSVLKGQVLRSPQDCAPSALNVSWRESDR